MKFFRTRQRRRPDQLRAARDIPLADAVPYTALVTQHVLHCRSDAYVQSFRIAGGSFETTDDHVINDWHERLNLLWKTIAEPGIALWSHLIRHPVEPTLPATGLAGFASSLAETYERRLAREEMRANEWYLTVVHKPVFADPTGKMDRGRRRSRPREGSNRTAAALATCERLAEQVLVGLHRYDIERLGNYETQGTTCSALLDHLGFLINTDQARTPLPALEVSEVLCRTRVLFGVDAVEYRTLAHRRLGAFLAIKEYPSPTSPGMLNDLLKANYSYILSQSYAFLPKATSQGLLARQYNRLQSSGDLAVSQALALRSAMDNLASNLFVLGDHHLSLQILTEPTLASDDPAALCAALEVAVADARIVLGDAGIVSAREDLAIEASYRAQLPGNFSERPRRAPVTSRNFAGLSSFHGHPTGRATGNHWGDALAVLRAGSGGPYYLSLHASDPADPDGGSRKDTGHTFVCGPTGSGKTVFVGFCIAMFTRQGVAQVVIDKDHGLELLIGALGGEYRTLEQGADTGLNPLRLPVNHDNVEFLRRWLSHLISVGATPSTVTEETDLGQALAGTLALPPDARCLSRLLEFLDPTEPNGPYARLSRWCRSADGAYGWVFDNADDRIVALLESTPLVGFDVTAFLRLPAVRGPLASYLFHLVRQIIDGRRLVVWMDEFSTLLDDSAFSAFSKDGLKTWRKMNAVAAFATQSPSDVLQSPIARTLIEQTPTKIFFPNPDADEKEHLEGFGLSRREYELIRYQLAPGSRKFLLKQGRSSVVCELDLKGMDAELTIISGRASTTRKMRELRGATGADPASWVQQLMSNGVRQ